MELPSHRWPPERHSTAVEQWARTEALHPHRSEDLLCRLECDSRCQTPRSKSLTMLVILCVSVALLATFCICAASFGGPADYHFVSR